MYIGKSLLLYLKLYFFQFAKRSARPCHAGSLTICHSAKKPAVLTQHGATPPKASVAIRDRHSVVPSNRQHKLRFSESEKRISKKPCLAYQDPSLTD